MPSILLIEDTPEMQRVYQFGLEHEGFSVEVVGSAGEGLTHVESGHYDIILLDLMLMGMSGLDFLAQSNIRAKAPATKVVVLTNVDNPEIVERVKAHGVDGYLVKSNTDPTQVATYLKQLLAGTAPATDPTAPPPPHGAEPPVPGADPAAPAPPAPPTA